MTNDELESFLKKIILDLNTFARTISGVGVSGFGMRGVRASIRAAALDILKSAARLEEAIEFANNSRKDTDEFRSMEPGIKRDRSG